MFMKGSYHYCFCQKFILGSEGVGQRTANLISGIGELSKGNFMKFSLLIQSGICISLVCQ